MKRIVAILILCFVFASMYARENAFVVHKHKCNSVCFYETQSFRHPIMKTYPNSEGAGIILEITGEVKNGFRVIVNNGIYYVKAGSLAVNPRGEILSLYDAPDINGRHMDFDAGKLEIFEPFVILNWQNGWIRTLIPIKGIKKTGWIHWKNQCPSPYTTCP